jgi:uncharacterized membrane protein YdjX (TVP38/TMEM64 family)
MTTALQRIDNMTRRAGTALIVLTVIVVRIPSMRMSFLHGLSLLATGQLAQFQQYLLSLGAWAPIMSCLLMVAAATVIPVPVTILMIVNGLVFGVWRGTAISFIGALAGALAAYVIGAGLGRAIAEHLLPARSLDAAERLMARRGWWAVVLGRLVPGIPCDPVSYAAGMMRMPILSFVVLTSVGLLPANLATAFLGAETAENVPLGSWLLALLLAIGVGIVWRLVRREQRRRLVPTADSP